MFNNRHNNKKFLLKNITSKFLLSTLIINNSSATNADFEYNSKFSNLSKKNKSNNYYNIDYDIVPSCSEVNKKLNKKINVNKNASNKKIKASFCSDLTIGANNHSKIINDIKKLGNTVNEIQKKYDSLNTNFQDHEKRLKVLESNVSKNYENIPKVNDKTYEKKVNLNTNIDKKIIDYPKICEKTDKIICANDLNVHNSQKKDLENSKIPVQINNISNNNLIPKKNAVKEKTEIPKSAEKTDLKFKICDLGSLESDVISDKSDTKNNTSKTKDESVQIDDKSSKISENTVQENISEKSNNSINTPESKIKKRKNHRVRQKRNLNFEKKYNKEVNTSVIDQKQVSKIASKKNDVENNNTQNILDSFKVSENNKTLVQQNDTPSNSLVLKEDIKNNSAQNVLGGSKVFENSKTLAQQNNISRNSLVSKEIATAKEKTENQKSPESNKEKLNTIATPSLDAKADAPKTKNKPIPVQLNDKNLKINKDTDHRENAPEKNNVKNEKINNFTSEPKSKKKKYENHFESEQLNEITSEASKENINKTEIHKSVNDSDDINRILTKNSEILKEISNNIGAFNVAGTVVGELTSITNNLGGSKKNTVSDRLDKIMLTIHDESFSNSRILFLLDKISKTLDEIKTKICDTKTQ